MRVFASDIGMLIVKIRLFADDSMMAAIGVDQMECTLRLQPALDAIILWAAKWKITINASKTKVITFQRSSSEQINLAINGNPIREVFSHCHLGVHIQEDLKWTTQVDNMLSRAKERMKVLKFHRYNFQATTL